MGMFDTSGKSDDYQSRKPCALKKLERMNKTLGYEIPTLLPISNVPGTTYNFIVNLVGEYRKYPLRLSEFEVEIAKSTKGGSK